MRSLHLNKTWRLKRRVSITRGGKHVLRGKSVFKIKRGPDGRIQKYKGRWVVRGLEQQEGSDYHETFAAAVKPMSYKALFAIAAALGPEIEQMDFKTAFLYDNVEEEICVEQMTGLRLLLAELASVWASSFPFTIIYSDNQGAIAKGSTLYSFIGRLPRTRRLFLSKLEQGIAGLNQYFS
jgi:hypothetical protein